MGTSLRKSSTDPMLSKLWSLPYAVSLADSTMHVRSLSWVPLQSPHMSFQMPTASLSGREMTSSYGALIPEPPESRPSGIHIRGNDTCNLDKTSG